MPRIFLSYDLEDESWRARFDDVFGRAHAFRYVSAADVPPGGGAAYARELRDMGYLDAETVVLVLIGPHTHASSKVDWEVAAALDGDGPARAGLVALRLPTHEDFRKPSVNPRRIPQRVADNLRSGYLNLHDWTESEPELTSRLEAALRDARGKATLAKNERALLPRDLPR
jgi:hypothetical protein